MVVAHNANPTNPVSELGNDLDLFDKEKAGAAKIKALDDLARVTCYELDKRGAFCTGW
jgi:hypothetical protein